MKCFIGCLMLLTFAAFQHAYAANVLRIANHNCDALSSAAHSAPGQEPALIVLARNGNYSSCSLQVVGNITIDGAGAQMALEETRADFSGKAQITIAAAGQLTIRNVNFGSSAGNAADASVNTIPGPKFLGNYNPVVINDGTLLLDSVSVTNYTFGFAIEKVGGGFIRNAGQLRVQNSTFFNVSEFTGNGLFSGDVQISHSTIAADSAGDRSVFSDGSIRVANSILVYTGGKICAAALDPPIQRISLGGNVASDDSCAFRGANDRVVADAHFLDFDLHGGVAKTLALNFDSPAFGNGLAANCAASDARGLSRGANSCDAGAYEIGGGNGALSATGMSGLYFNASNNGHYISIQKLYKDAALVIWNTFDENGVPAWLYGVGTFSANQIHVPQVARNVGGKLHAGGAVDVSTPTLWGSFDVNLNDCYNATLTYSSPLPEFGSGSTTLQRLAFLDGVNCAR